MRGRIFATALARTERGESGNNEASEAYSTATDTSAAHTQTTTTTSGGTRQRSRSRNPASAIATSLLPILLSDDAPLSAAQQIGEGAHVRTSRRPLPASIAAADGSFAHRMLLMLLVDWRCRGSRKPARAAAREGW